MHLVNLPAVRVRAAETLSHTMVSVGHALARDHLDVAFVFNAANAPFVRPLRLAGIPVAVHVDGLEWQRAKWGPRASAYYRWAEARSARWADAVIADAQGIADHMHSAHGVAPGASPTEPRSCPQVPSAWPSWAWLARGYHLVVARFEPENHVLEIVTGYVESAMHACPLWSSATPRTPRPTAPRYGRPLPSTPGSTCSAASGTPTCWTRSMPMPRPTCTATAWGARTPRCCRAMGAGAPVTAYDVVFNREVAGSAGLLLH